MIRLQVLLRDDWRHEEGVRRVQDRLRSLGMKPTAAGQVTVSAEASPDTFRDTFGPHASTGATLAVPAPLAPYVESISVAPPHVRMGPKDKE
jgi:hypothetical protein